jgi:hypothetical protein
MIADAGDDVAQIGFGIEAIKPPAAMQNVPVVATPKRTSLS